LLKCIDGIQSKAQADLFNEWVVYNAEYQGVTIAGKSHLDESAIIRNQTKWNELKASAYETNRV